MVHFGQPLRTVFGVFPEVAQLALLAHAGDGLNRELDLVGVRPVRVRLRPPVHVVWQTVRQLIGATRAELRGSDRLAAHVNFKKSRCANYIVNRRGHDRARIRRFLDEEEPVPGRVVLKARDTPGPHEPDDTRHPLARKPLCDTGTLTSARPRFCRRMRALSHSTSTTNMLLGWPTQTQRRRIPDPRVDASAARGSPSPTRTR